MAQALFDDHPIEHYLRESGEIPELMPGGMDEFSREPAHDDDPYHIPLIREWLPRLLNTALQFLESTGLRSPSPASEFAERFKYVVISSPLLSSSLATASVSRAPTPTTPGHYEHGSSSLPATTPTTAPAVASAAPQLLTFSLACLVPAALAQGYYLSGMLILAAVKVCADGGVELPSSLKPNRGDESWNMTLESLEALVSANNAWDGVMSEALGILEDEERNLFQPPSPTSLSPSLRIALSSSLHTTQTQCDNVRQLLAALTSPLVLSQLSHMYAPPSPSQMPTSPKRRTRPMSLAAPSPALAFPRINSYTHAPSPSPTRMRPMSLVAPQPTSALPRSNSFTHAPSLSTPPDDSYTRARTSSAPQTFPTDKRSTWNGSYMSLAGGPSPRRQKGRSNLSNTFSPEDLKSPKSPTFPVAVSEDISGTPPQPVTIVEDASGDADAEDEPFGVTALDIHRKRRSTRVLMFDTPSPSSSTTLVPPSSISPSRSNGSSRSTSLYEPPPSVGSHGSPLTSSFGSRFTSLSSAASSSRNAHPLSLSNLHLALQGALGSKRFACAHLLALRFADPAAQAHRGLGSDADSDTDGEDESYWEDVRSVISLLTSTIEDASARLAEALADTVRREQEQEQLTDEESCAESASASAEPVESKRRSTSISPLASHSFAPMPSHLTRFAAHVDAITSALDDAGEHLRECVRSLRDVGEASADGAGLDPPAVALQSYERLRRELGLALRECERGRGTLLEIVQRGTPDGADEEGDEESPVRHEDHFSSGESDQTLFNADELPESKEPREEQEHHEQGSPPHDDDASSHLILTATSQHLPPPGIEQVFESMSAAQPFTRERSKLTRDERIRIAKARRESRFSVLGPVPDAHEEEQRPARESWGPGGEVVQELKDVIWKVGEQRRKMVERTSSHGLHPDATHYPPS